MLPSSRHDAAPPAKLREVITNPGIWPVIAASSLAHTGLELFAVYIPVYGKALALSASAIGSILAASAVGGFASRLVLPALVARSSGEKVLAYALIVGGVSICAIPFTQSIFVLCALAMVFGCGLNCSQPIVMTLMYARSPEGRAGEALGLRFAIDNIVRLAAPVIFGFVASGAGLAAVFWVSALMLAGGGYASRLGGERNAGKE
jgi:DHA1 family multidrug resistance protein-like MFS transporter